MYSSNIKLKSWCGITLIDSLDKNLSVYQNLSVKALGCYPIGTGSNPATPISKLYIMLIKLKCPQFKYCYQVYCWWCIAELLSGICEKD